MAVGFSNLDKDCWRCTLAVSVLSPSQLSLLSITPLSPSLLSSLSLWGCVFLFYNQSKAVNGCRCFSGIKVIIYKDCG